jgi:DNA-binding NtrC family response regulator
MAQDRKYLIFLVDDDAKHLLLLKEHLSKHLPYTLDIRTYTNGDDAMVDLPANPDLIILDYYFDGEDKEASDGVEVLKKIKNKRTEIPVVMMSHQDKIEVAVTCYDYGAKDYIIKNETAYARAQLVVRNVIHEINKETVASKFKESTKIAYTILGLFILFLMGFVIYLVTSAEY